MRIYLASILCLIASPVRAQEAAPKIWDVEKLSQAPEFKWVDDKSPVRSLIFTGPEYQGHPTEVFAFYATPGTVSQDFTKDRKLPAVVLLHGGGGTAFAEWVNLWAKRGYAAIALDFSGRRAEKPVFDQDTQELQVERNHRNITRTRLQAGGPDHTHVEKFENAGGDLTDDWQYHAISNILLAHSLVRSFPEVDAERTAVTGISWGGYLTCLTASVDSRFKAAVPVYGCGFLHEGESVQKVLIDRLPAEKKANWIKMYDPSRHLVNCHVPVLFVNGTNDKHYPLDSYMKSYRAVPGEKNLRIEVGMRHSHPAGWEPSEIERFIASYINGSPKLAKVALPTLKGNKATTTYTSEVPILKSQFHWTTNDGPLVDRKWNSVKAKLDTDNNSLAADVPGETTLWYFTVTDQQGQMTSSEVVFTK